MKKIPLHIQITIALLFGAIFGAIFSINSRQIIIEFQNDSGVQEQTIENWQYISFSYYDNENKLVEKKYSSDSQTQIIKSFESLPAKIKENIVFKVDYDNRSEEFKNIFSIRKRQTPATWIKPIGTIFISLLSFVAIPMVLSSLIVGAASIEDIKKLGRIGSKTFIMFMVTTALAVTIGLILANTIKPGEQITPDVKNKILGEYQTEAASKMKTDVKVDLVDFVVNIVPRNPFKAMSEGDMLQIVFFAVMFGITLTFVDRKYSLPVKVFMTGVSETMIKMVHIVMKVAPYGVFALIASTVAEFGFDVLITLFWYAFCVVGGLIIQTILVYAFLVKVFGKMSPFKFFKGMTSAQAIAFSSSSSAATLPVNMECCEENLGVPQHISRFVLPLGATINMDGTALYQGVATVFIAQVYGMDLTLAQQLTVIFTAVLASIGTAPVPGVGIIMLIMILQAVNVPPEGIALIIGIDRILDMIRTVTNITGDASVTVAIAGTEGYKLKE